MKKAALAILLSVCVVMVFAQQNPVIQNSVAYDESKVRPFLSQLHDKNDYVLTFRTLRSGYSEELFDYFVLTKKADRLAAYNYNASGQQLEEYKLPPDSLQLLWKAYTEFNMFKIRDEKEEFIFCPDKYHIDNLYTYEILMLAGDRMKKLSYQDAEYYNRVCSGMAARTDIINTASLLHYVVKAVVVEPFRITAY